MATTDRRRHSRPCGSRHSRCQKRTGRNTRAAGGALLTVLWLSAALSAIAFSLANTVRGEVERTSTSVDGTRSYYLAAGAIERAILYMQWGPQHLLPDGSSRFYTPGAPFLHLTFPSGETLVEIIPETAKFNVNSSPPEELFRLLINLGVETGRAREITLAIVDWRSPAPGGNLTVFDQYYLSITPSFRARHASFEEIEELLLIKGMTRDLFYGTYDRDPGSAPPRLVARGGVSDCISVYGATDRFDANTARPAVLSALGLSPEAVAALLERRRAAPFRTQDQLAAFAQLAGPAANRLRIGGNSIFTLRATARLRLPDGKLSDLRRTVAAMVKFMPPGYDVTHQILRWYDTAWSH